MNLRAVQSGSARIRLRQAHQFVSQFPAGTEVLLLGASRGAVDDLARTIAMEKGATFGLHRLSFTQLAARLAASDLAAGGQAPASALGYEAVAARAAFEAAKDDALDYFSPVSNTPGFPKALARTLQELRLAGVAAGSLGGLLRSGPDLADLLDRVETLMSEAGASDRASLFATATKALTAAETGWASMPVLLLDVPFESDAEARFLWTLVEKIASTRLSRSRAATRGRSSNSRNAASRSRHSIRTATRISRGFRVICFRRSRRRNVSAAES